MKRTGIACRLPDAGLEISGGWRRTFFGGLEYSYLSGAVARKSAGLCCAKRLGVRMRVLVIGAGVLGSLYAGRLAAAGNEVTLLARGSRLAELQREPLRLVNDADGTSTLATLAVVPKLEPTDAYDMGLVMVRADQVKDLLPKLSANSGVKFFLFMHNRAAGSSALARAVGPGRLFWVSRALAVTARATRFGTEILRSSRPPSVSRMAAFRSVCGVSRSSLQKRVLRSP